MFLIASNHADANITSSTMHDGGPHILRAKDKAAHWYLDLDLRQRSPTLLKRQTTSLQPNFETALVFYHFLDLMELMKTSSLVSGSNKRPPISEEEIELCEMLV